MSSVVVKDCRGGVFEVEVHFTYGECDRLPYNSLRRAKAVIEETPGGGVCATTRFNLRDEGEAGRFIDTLRLFGEDGTFIHGSPADPEVLRQQQAPAGEPGANLTRAIGGSATSFTPAAAPANDAYFRSAPDTPAAEEEIVVEEEARPALPPSGTDTWALEGDELVEACLANNDDRTKTLARLSQEADARYTPEMAKTRIMRLLHAKFQDQDYVASVMKRRGWDEVTPREVAEAVS